MGSSSSLAGCHKASPHAIPAACVAVAADPANTVPLGETVHQGTVVPVGHSLVLSWLN